MTPDAQVFLTPNANEIKGPRHQTCVAETKPIIGEASNENIKSDILIWLSQGINPAAGVPVSPPTGTIPRRISGAANETTVPAPRLESPTAISLFSL